MSTPSRAVYNRCRPVRPWNGLSSASPPRRVTMRCWKGCRGTGEEGSGKREDVKREAGGGRRCMRAAMVAAILFVPTLLFAQNKQPVIPEHPEVVNLTLK